MVLYGATFNGEHVKLSTELANTIRSLVKGSIGDNDVRNSIQRGLRETRKKMADDAIAEIVPAEILEKRLGVVCSNPGSQCEGSQM